MVALVEELAPLKSLGFILWVPQMSEWFYQIHDEIFHSINEDFDLLGVPLKKHKITKVIRVHPLRTVNVCTKILWQFIHEI